MSRPVRRRRSASPRKPGESLIERIKEIAALGKEIHVQKISLLPYHEGGKSKCQQLGMLYGFTDGKTPDEKQISRLKKIIEKAGLAVSVGN